MEFEQRKIKVFMFPWLAHGHISPFLELAKSLTKRNFMVYLCSTPVNFGSIERLLTTEFTDSIKLVELQVPTFSGLPPNYHTTKNLPPHLMPTLKKALDKSAFNFSKLLYTLKPDLLVYDTIQPWAPIIASKHEIPAVAFVSTSATMTSVMLHRYKYPPGIEFPFSEISLRDYEDDKLVRLLKSPENIYREKNRFVDCLEQSSEMILIKSSPEIERKHIDHLEAFTGKKIVPVGPLVQKPSITDDDNSSIIQWLDKKELGSTVFVSFGSEYFLSKEEREEMAHGLDLSGVNFIWVVRFSVEEKMRVEEAMPRGFFERVKGRGLVVQGWAPQVKILEHPNVGGFVSHCGWSSMMEGISYGAPIIAVPMHLDQPVNARLSEAIGVGVEVRRDENGRLVRDEVAKVIKQVVVENTGKVVKKKQRELNENMRVKGEEMMDGVAEELVRLWRKNNVNKKKNLKTKEEKKKNGLVMNKVVEPLRS